jgi:hypothetical protein
MQLAESPTKHIELLLLRCTSFEGAVDCQATGFYIDSSFGSLTRFAEVKIPGMKYGKISGMKMENAVRKKNPVCLEKDPVNYVVNMEKNLVSIHILRIRYIPNRKLMKSMYG